MITTGAEVMDEIFGPQQLKPRVSPQFVDERRGSSANSKRGTYDGPLTGRVCRRCAVPHSICLVSLMLLCAYTRGRAILRSGTGEHFQRGQ